MTQRVIIGIDEVGRGPLAGPITVAAVAATGNSKHEILNSKLKQELKNIKDSKKLSARQREEWFLKLKEMPHAIASVSPAVIDAIGIAPAIRRAVRSCLKKLSSRFPLDPSRFTLLLDGSLYAPENYKNQQTITKGDEKVPIIAVASVIAKVTRDRHMVRMHKKYPQYGFGVHKGYGTARHQQAIRTHGLCDIHRKTFCRKILKT